MEALLDSDLRASENGSMLGKNQRQQACPEHSTESGGIARGIRDARPTFACSCDDPPPRPSCSPAIYRR